jgi:hypothetical protein
LRYVVEGSDEEFEQAWQRLLESWDDSKAHDAFLSMCHEHGNLGLAAAKYRSVIDSGPDDRKSLAQKRIGAVALLATQALEATREERRPGVPRWLTLLVAAFTASAVGWLAYALLKR